jgi:hypothetical protein
MSGTEHVDLSAPSKHAANCRWSVPTVLMSYPIWLGAERRPWTCTRRDKPHPLRSTELCEVCGLWEARPNVQRAAQIAGSRVDGPLLFMDILANSMPPADDVAGADPR